MNWTRPLKLLTLLAFGATTGCELQPCPKDDPADGEPTEETKSGNCIVLKSLKKFEGNTIVENTAWASGSSVVVEGFNGSIEIRRGTVADQVAVTATPFVMRAYDTPAAEARQDIDNLDVRVGTDTDPGAAVRVLTTKTGSRQLGADLVIEIPEGFDGAIDVTNGNGQTRFRDAISATAVTVFQDNGGLDATLGDVGALDITSDNGSIEVGASSVSGVRIVGDNGNVTATFGALAADATGGTISTGNGDVLLGMPGDGAFVIEATAGQGVDFGAPPSTCVEAEATLTCNDGTAATFTVEAGSLGDVTVSYN